MNLVPWKKKRNADSDWAATAAPLARLRRDMDMLFERFFRDPWGALEDFGDGGSLLTAMPRMDVAESDKDVTVTLELPGVDPK
ncbi:MAG: hypothetical protein D6788_04485, partial [Planctomycetota bacterium]